MHHHPMTTMLRSLGLHRQVPQKASSVLLKSCLPRPSLSSSSSPPPSSHTRGLSTAAADLAPETDAEVFERLVAFRCSMKTFMENEVPEDVLKSILAVTQRAPTSFNLQPYKVIVVKSPKAREQLASCMLGPNKRRVTTAPVTAVFAADLEPTRLVSRLIEMERKRGTPEAYLANLPFQVAFLAGEGQLAHAFKEAVATAMSPIQAMPSVNNVDAWSFKNTMLAAGYGDERVLEDLTKTRRTPRFPPETVIHLDGYGQPYKGIPVL